MAWLQKNVRIAQTLSKSKFYCLFDSLFNTTNVKALRTVSIGVQSTYNEISVRELVRELKRYVSLIGEVFVQQKIRTQAPSASHN